MSMEAEGVPSRTTQSIWQRMAQPSPAPRPTLTHARIAEAALRIADADGVASVSMRRLAVELGVSAMTCYRYVAGKDDVLELMVDAVRAGMLLDERPDHWRAALRASALRFRGVILRHPWMSDVPGRILLAPTPSYLAVVEQNMAALAGLGLDIEQMADITGAVTAYTRASTHDEVGRARAQTPDEAAAQNTAHDRMTWLLDSGDYPTYERYIRSGPHHTDEEARFEFGLDCLLDGIASRLNIQG